jgi:TatA/E family protein of Tat protein translocase
MPGHMEIVLILIIALVIFGPTQLPKLAKSIRESKKVLKDGEVEEVKVNEEVKG